MAPGPPRRVGRCDLAPRPSFGGATGPRICNTAHMRVLAVVLAGSLIASGCAVNSYKIPPDELARLARVPPEARGAHVRVVQEIVASDVPAAPPVTRETQVVIVPQFDVAVGVHGPRAGFGGGGLGRGVGKLGGLGKDSKSAAVAFLFVAATAMVTAVVIEGRSE